MSTENGLEPLKFARRDIEVLRGRLEFIAGRIEAMVAEGHVGRAGFLVAESRALAWALPVLEAEFDNLARMHRNARHIEQYPRASEGRWPLVENELCAAGGDR